jgi:hypothetical protein
MTTTAIANPEDNERINDIVRKFANAFNQAEDSFRAAGKIYAEAIMEFGQTARERLAAACPTIAPSTWRRLEALGNGSLDARLLTASSKGAASLRRLPAPIQTRALDEGVEVLIGNGESLRVQVDNLTPDQTRQVFAGDHIRDVSAQRAWLESNAPQIARPSATKPTPQNPVEIDRKHRRILVHGYPLTVADMAEYIRKLTNDA